MHSTIIESEENVYGTPITFVSSLTSSIVVGFLDNVLSPLGDDVFTNGKPHPMIEPSIRLDRIIQEAKDEEVKVILMDFEIGYGSHMDPVGVTVPAILEAKQIAKDNNREIAFVGYVQGSENDKQNKEEQIKKLKEIGVLVEDTNAKAVKLALSIQKGENL